MEHEAENPLRETRSDGDGQGQDSDEYERFHWPCYRHVPSEIQGSRAGEPRGLRGNLDPGAFACLDEKTGADQALHDTGGGVRGHLQ